MLENRLGFPRFPGLQGYCSAHCLLPQWLGTTLGTRQTLVQIHLQEALFPLQALECQHPRSTLARSLVFAVVHSRCCLTALPGLQPLRLPTSLGCVILISWLEGLGINHPQETGGLWVGAWAKKWSTVHQLWPL